MGGSVRCLQEIDVASTTLRIIPLAMLARSGSGLDALLLSAGDRRGRASAKYNYGLSGGN